MNGIDVDGTLATRGPGHRGEVALRLDHLLVEPVLPVNPGDVRMSGIVSGDVVVRVAPGEAAALRGTLSDLTLDVWRSPNATRPPPSAIVRLHAVGPIPVSATADGAKTLGPAHFAGDAGVLDVVARSVGQEFRATARGRVELAAVVPLAAPLLSRAAGALAVDLAATWRGAGGRLTLDGDVAVAKPVSVRLAPFAATVSIPAGRGRFVDGAFDTAGLPVVVAADFPAASLVAHGAGALSVDAHVPASGAPIKLSLESRTLLLQIPLVGETPVATGGGTVRFEGDLAAFAAFDEAALREIDLPLRGVARHMTMAAGKIDHATFDLRLTGIPRRTLTLSGDVDILGARVRSDRASGARAKTDARVVDEPPTLHNPRLDLRVRARDGAVTVELPNAPDVHVDIDARARGTLARPVVTAEARPAGVYSTILMALQRLLQ